jgi:hypothetical protein
LGYARGDPEDIKAFYDTRKYYTLRLEKAEVVDVRPGDVKQRRSLMEEKERLETRLKQVEGQLRAEREQLGTRLKEVEGKLKVRT